MGGTPYQSKGCNTCRRRKVKCDEAKPECMRCLKNGHVCTGYERNYVFIHNSIEYDKILFRRSRDPVKKGTSQAVESSLPKTQLDISHFNVNSGVRTQFVANFIDCFEPSAEIRDGKGAAVTHLQDTFPLFVSSSLVLDKAITALSAAFLAKRQHDPDLLVYSTRLYGEALQIVHSRIQSGRKCGQDSLFATVIFQLYELINSSPLGFRAWLAHVQGSNAILAQYESPNPPSVSEHLFCRQLKFVTVCDAIGMRKSVYSYNQFWRAPPVENPWRQPVDDILDLIIKCSELIEQIDVLIHHGVPRLLQDQNTAKVLLSRGLSLRDQLDYSYGEMQEKLGTPWSSPHQSSFWTDLDHSIPQYLFSSVIEFPSLTCAESHLLWWTTFILLYPLINDLLIFLGRSRNSVSLTIWDVTSLDREIPSHVIWPSGSPESLVDVAEHYADLICRSAKFLVQPETKAMGAQILLAPFSQATQFFHSQGATEKHRWCQSVFMVLPRLGFGIAPFLKDMIWPKYEAATGKKVSSPESEAN
ncbi:hypothetical protein N7462_006973 [Penicillium macrosclerotiorum]|uniref:uncharacterized protein n=1 Tax=Penicillium macrosclerotiorum TaxID=303699 RepID=UPI002546D2C3|nr:uncharacterized protein N7462_006973 [Penicillium macrosclerotiorum]KAJ5678729.1 hypothetical protein N7462_006973 [Penicillium macrosclerotiorum]